MSELQVASTRLDIVDGQLTAVEGRPFAPESYSRMKYGSQRYARELGVALGDDIVAQAQEIVEDQTALRALVIYKHVPSAATTVTNGVLARINQHRLELGLDTAHTVHVRTDRVLGRDYSSQNEQGRAQYIKDTGYNLQPHDVADSNVIVIDDIRVTGSAEDLVRRLLRGTQHRDLVLGYSSVMNQSAAAKDPAMEKSVNTSSVTGLDDLSDIIANDGMSLTVRTLKMVLGEADQGKLTEFLHTIPNQLLFEIYSGALGSGTEFIDYYANGFRAVQLAAKNKGIIS